MLETCALGRQMWLVVVKKVAGEFVAAAVDFRGRREARAFCDCCAGRWSWLLRNSFGVQSVTHMTRLETRTKEFKVYASH